MGAGDEHRGHRGHRDRDRPGTDDHHPDQLRAGTQHPGHHHHDPRGHPRHPHLAAADLTCRDDTGSTITLSPVGAPNVPVGAGTTATVHVRGVFRSGAAQITWHPGGHPLALWDFNVELD